MGCGFFEDITFADSMGHTFYALPDFSYVVAEAGQLTLYGEGYRIRNGHIVQLTHHGEFVRIV